MGLAVGGYAGRAAVGRQVGSAPQSPVQPVGPLEPAPGLAETLSLQQGEPQPVLQLGAAFREPRHVGQPLCHPIEHRLELHAVALPPFGVPGAGPGQDGALPLQKRPHLAGVTVPTRRGGSLRKGIPQPFQLGVDLLLLGQRLQRPLGQFAAPPLPRLVRREQAFHDPAGQAAEQLKRARRVEPSLGQRQRPPVPRDGRVVFPHLESDRSVALLEDQLGLGVVEGDPGFEPVAVVLPGSRVAPQQEGDVAYVELQVGPVLRVFPGAVQEPGPAVVAHGPLQGAMLAMDRLHDLGQVAPGLGGILRFRHALGGAGDAPVRGGQALLAGEVALGEPRAVQEHRVIRVARQQPVVERQKLLRLPLGGHRLDVAAVGLQAAPVVADQVQEQGAGRGHLPSPVQLLAGGQGLADIGGARQLVERRLLGLPRHLLLVQGGRLVVALLAVEHLGQGEAGRGGGCGERRELLQGGAVGVLGPGPLARPVGQVPDPVPGAHGKARQRAAVALRQRGVAAGSAASSPAGSTAGQRSRLLQDGGDGRLGPLLLVAVIAHHRHQGVQPTLPSFQPGEQESPTVGGLRLERPCHPGQGLGLLQEFQGRQLVLGSGAQLGEEPGRIDQGARLGVGAVTLGRGGELLPGPVQKGPARGRLVQLDQALGRLEPKRRQFGERPFPGELGGAPHHLAVAGQSPGRVP